MYVQMLEVKDVPPIWLIDALHDNGVSARELLSIKMEVCLCCGSFKNWVILKNYKPGECPSWVSIGLAQPRNQKIVELSRDLKCNSCGFKISQHVYNRDAITEYYQAHDTQGVYKRVEIENNTVIVSGEIEIIPGLSTSTFKVITPTDKKRRKSPDAKSIIRL